MPTNAHPNRVVVDLVAGLRTPPCPIDACHFVGAKVYCTYAQTNLSPPPKVHIGHIENSGAYRGTLTLLSSGNGLQIPAHRHDEGSS